MMFDTTLKRHVIVDELDYPWIYKYVRKRYFSGYLDRYDLQLTICNEDDSVLIKPDNQLYHCFSFFNNLTQNRAEKITSHSYFLKNSNGRISYFIMVNYNKNSERFRIFIQLDSRLNIDVLGYPQFLISDDYSKNNLLKGYSYAKYYKNKISYQSGSFFYNVNSVKYPSFKGQYFKQSFGGYDHLFYKYDNDNLIVLSRPSLSFFDLLVSFSYLFIFNFILLNIILLSIQNQKFNLKLLIGGFRTRIQISLISLMLFSLLLVGGITIYFIIEQYNKKHFESISEKLQSIYLELENLLTEENKLTYIWRNEEYSNLESFLRHLSNIFSTDINLYNNKGQLVASSRSEIFEKGLCGNVINPYAYHQLLRNNKNEYIHFEKLGNQKYLSIYTPFINKRGAVIGYLNLPYFIQQSKIREEISSMILAIVNFYVLLMLIAIFVAVVLAKNITKPLEIIHESISQMKLGKGNIKIIYKGNDEIGNLISEYNKKVDELERSVELLSKIERESAWKEMARQVAHEIKNPLTPMKLNVQQLQKKWQQNHYLEDEYIQKVTKSIIEQIDNLSNIASAFSSLAKMPSPKNERININELIENIVQLFSDSRVKIYCNIGSTMNCYVLADKDQLSRVFINLITNAIQAIPSSIGEIKIYSFKEDKIKMIIEDNGVGISEEMRKKLFQPNFTTKSGGSGLGLAICKSIIDYIGGNISYEPNEPVGSKFILTLPFEII